MNDTRKARLLAHINRKDWWHVPPRDPRAYDKRGKFYASSFRESEFWGRPLDTPEHVNIQNPIVGDEPSVHRVLFGAPIRRAGRKSLEAIDDAARILEWRWKLDARMKKAALAKGYDAIVIVTAPAFKQYRAGDKIPRSIELNVLNPAWADHRSNTTR